LDIGLTDHFNTQLVITRNYSTVANFHTLQLPRVYTNSLPARIVFTSSCLLTASDNGHPSASALRSSLNVGSFPAEHLQITRSRFKPTSYLSLYRLTVNWLSWVWERVLRYYRRSVGESVME
jgi:hypothetical protein